MKAGQAKIYIQETLGIPERSRAPNIGPMTRAAFETLALTPSSEDWPKTTQGVAPTLSGRNINARGLDLVKHFESFFPEAYFDTVAKPPVWTIGYGHTGLVHNDGTVRKGRTITRAEALALLDYDMNQSEAAVTALSAPTNLNDDQFSALVSWHFNTGGPKSATLWAKVRAGKLDEAADQLLLWDKVAGKAVRGLTRRRESERKLFLGLTPYILES